MQLSCIFREKNMCSQPACLKVGWAENPYLSYSMCFYCLYLIANLVFTAHSIALLCNSGILDLFIACCQLSMNIKNVLQRCYGLTFNRFLFCLENLVRMWFYLLSFSHGFLNLFCEWCIGDMFRNMFASRSTLNVWLYLLCESRICIDIIYCYKIPVVRCTLDVHVPLALFCLL